MANRSVAKLPLGAAPRSGNGGVRKPDPIAWAWAGDKGVKVGKVEFVLKPKITAKQLVKYLEDLEVESEVFMGLVTARAAISSGRAENYDNAEDKLRHLTVQARGIEQRLAEMSEVFSEFFSPSGLNRSFVGHNQQYSQMTRKLVIRLIDALESKKGSRKK